MEDIERYFRVCGEERREPTAPGLCLEMGLTPDKFMELSEGSDELARVIMAGRLRLQDVVERKSDSMSVLKIKQPIYGGYTDKPQAEQGGDAVIRVLMELTGSEEAAS